MLDTHHPGRVQSQLLKTFKSITEELKMKCRCLIKHAVTEEERKEAKLELAHARDVGCKKGIQFALARLEKCWTVKKG